MSEEELDAFLAQAEELELGDPEYLAPYQVPLELRSYNTAPVSSETYWELDKKITLEFRAASREPNLNFTQLLAQADALLAECKTSSLYLKPQQALSGYVLYAFLRQTTPAGFDVKLIEPYLQTLLDTKYLDASLPAKSITAYGTNSEVYAKWKPKVLTLIEHSRIETEKLNRSHEAKVAGSRMEKATADRWRILAQRNQQAADLLK